MEYGQKIRREAAGQGLSAAEYVYALLRLHDVDRVEAWHISSWGLDATAPKSYIDGKIKGAEAKVKPFITAQREAKQDGFDPNDKQSIIMALQREVMKDEPNKAKIDGLNKIADLQRMKQEEVVTDNNTVHYYLPLKCKMCPRYREHEEAKRK